MYAMKNLKVSMISNNDFMKVRITRNFRSNDCEQYYDMNNL